ncbi:MAG: aromatic amino acid DMT transporter YddG [Lentisphaerae bacterium]|nr:aromatic amino acid DMT transporter YddG [Lentisphaerota bacterium]
MNHDHAWHRRGTTLGTLTGLVSVLLWSTTVALQRSLSEALGPLGAPAAVFSVAGAIALVRLAASGTLRTNLRGMPPRYLAVCGPLFVTNLIVLFLGIGLARTRQQAIEVGLLNYLWPATTMIGAVFLLRKRAGLGLWFGTLVAIAGVVFAMTAGQGITWNSVARNVASAPLAYTFGLMSAITWGLYSNLTRRWAGPQGAGAVDLFLPLTGVFMLIVQGLIGKPLHWNTTLAIEAACLGTFSWLAYACWDFAMRRGSVVLVAACSYLTPILSILCSSLYLHIRPPATVWLGAALIVLGSLVSWRSVDDMPAVAPCPTPPPDGAPPHHPSPLPQLSAET